MQASIGVLLNRVNGTGNSGAQVQTQGNNQITVTVPGKAATNVVQLISTTAYLTFRPVLLDRAVHGGDHHHPGAEGHRHPVGDAQWIVDEHRHVHRVADPVGQRFRQRDRERQHEGVHLRRLRRAREPDRQRHRHLVGEGDNVGQSVDVPAATATPPDGHPARRPPLRRPPPTATRRR